MKKEILGIIVALSTFAWGEDNIWQQTFEVRDEQGKPLDGVDVTVVSPDYRGQVMPTGRTDENGRATLSGRRSLLLKCGAKLEGYYETKGVELHFSWKPKKNAEGKTVFDLISKQEAMPIVLKKKKKPIAMYAKWVRNLKIPVKDKEVGYDMKVGDWIAPHGKGVVSDFLFLSSEDMRNEKDYKKKISIRFSNKGDGLVAYKHDYRKGGSELRSEHQAPDAKYQDSWNLLDIRQPGKSHIYTADPNQNYYFRIRTKLDNEGNIVSAHYGKIYGDFPNIRHYFNPVPNDRNIEFDPKRNLNTNLRNWEEEVEQP